MKEQVLKALNSINYDDVGKKENYMLIKEEMDSEIEKLKFKDEKVPAFTTEAEYFINKVNEINNADKSLKKYRLIQQLRIELFSIGY